MMATQTATLNATASLDTTITATITAVDLEPHAPRRDDSSSSLSTLKPTRSWRNFRSSISISEKTTANLGWAIAFLSVLCTVIALSPAFKSQDLSEKALKLAEWTALKDYIEECREELEAGIQSQPCLRAMEAKLPPPPYVKPGILDKMKRNLVHVPLEHNSTSRGAQTMHHGINILAFVEAIAVLAVIITAIILLILSFERKQSRLARHRTPPVSSTDDGNSPVPTPLLFSDSSTAATTIRYPPPSPSTATTTLRRRLIRTHPIYQHSSLSSALHHENIPEIRTRLQNGEDIAPHWPYIIFKLAMSPPSTITPKRLEIARLCLDFGADVNAQQAWNGQSALKIAIHFGNVDVAKLLIANGAMVCHPGVDDNLTALHHCVRFATTGSAKGALEIMQTLFRHGARIDQADRLAETPLHKLVIEAWFHKMDREKVAELWPVAKCLLEHGARVPERIGEKYTVGNPLWDMVRMAVEKGELAGPVRG